MVCSLNKILPAIHHHLPGLVVGVYFVSIQFIYGLDVSYLILLLGLSFLLAVQPSINLVALNSGATAIAGLLLLSTILSSSLGTADPICHAMPIAQIPGLLVFLIVALFIREKSQIGAIVWSYFAALGITVGRFISAGFTDEGTDRGKELIYAAAQPLYLAPNDVLMLVIFLPIIIWYFGLSTKMGKFFVGIYSIIFIILSQLLLSRMALLSIAVIFVVPALLSRRWKILLVMALALLMGLTIFVQYDSALLLKLQAHNIERVRLWVIGWEMFLDAPWFGHGPGAFSALYSHYLERPALALADGNDARHMGWAHSLFLESAVEKGMLGFCIALGYFIYLFAVLYKKINDRSDGSEKAFGLSIALLLIAAIFELSMLRVWAIYEMYLMLGLVAALLRLDSSSVSTLSASKSGD